MSAQLPLDAEQRAAALDPTSSYCVTAPAGSGKTELLSQRVLALLAQVEQPEEILAITFTRKAAAEMRERILHALRAAQSPQPEEAHKKQTWLLAHAALQRDAERDWKLLENPARLRVQTIDGFCGSLTAQMPVLSQFGGQPRVTEQPQSLYRAAVDALLEELEGDDAVAASLGALLLHVDNRVERLHELLAALLACRDQWLPHIGSGMGVDSADVRRRLEQTLRQVRDDAVQSAHEALLIYAGELLPLLDFAARQLAEAQPDHPLAALRGIAALPAVDAVASWRAIVELLLKKDGDWRKQVDKRCGFPPGEGREQKALHQQRKQSMQALLETLAQDGALHEALTEILQLPAAQFADAQWQLLLQLTQVLRRAAVQLQVVFQSRGEVDFTEVSLSALRALGSALEPSELMLRLDYRLRHLLIDEFQDTSTTQYRLLERLVEGWREQNEMGGEAHTLFIVGDGMQSIYGFREAKVGLFLEAREQGVNQLPLRDAPLRVNFRSTPTVVNWINRVFEQAFPQREHTARGAVPYEFSTAFNAEREHSEVAVYGVRNDPDRSGEAEQCVLLVQRALAADPQGSIAILVRSRPHLRALVPALTRAGIAYHATDIDPLAQRAAVQDVLSLLKALCNPADRIAWLALLRSPLVGLDNHALHALAAGADGSALRQSLLTRLRSGQWRQQLDADAAARLDRVLPVLERGWQQRSRKSLRGWLEGLWLALGGDLLCASDSAWEDVQVLFELIEQYGDALDIDDLQRRLVTLYARGDRAVDTRVSLLTIHKSKGLEFDTVIVPGLDAGSRSDDRPLLRWSEYLAADGELGLVLAPKPAIGAADDPIYDWLDFEQKQKQILEDTRLLYVAATRAIARLYLVFRSRDEQEFTPTARSLLGRIWSAVEAEVRWSEPPLSARAATADIESADDEALRRVPAAWPLTLEAEPAAPGANVPAPMAAILEAQTGSTLHRLLEMLARFGSDSWHGHSAAAQQRMVEQLLRQFGVLDAEIPAARALVLDALNATLSDERGRWLLDHRHAEAVVEWELLNELGKRFVIDRSFVHEGVRWIVDYKSSLPHAGEALETFAAREQALYRDQLWRYRELVAAFEPRPIRLALYFPRAAHWLEFEP